MRRFVLALLLALLAVVSSASAATSITARPTTDGSGYEVTGVPEGTEHIGVAVMPKLAATGSEVRYCTAPAAQKIIRPDQCKLGSAYTVIDLQAWSGCCKGTGHAIGGWAGRLQTHEPPPPEEPKEPPHEEPPHEEPPPPPPPPPTGFLPGLNAGYWGSGELVDLHDLGVSVVRLDTPSNTTSWEGVTTATGAHLKVIADESGPYSSSGVSGVNRNSYIERDIKLIRSAPGLYAVETLNEPGGSWFWGSNSESTTNREAYAHLVIAVHEALVREFGAARPLQLCSFDGGHDSSNAWGLGWSKVPGALAACDALTNHPYGGHGEHAIEGNRALVKQTHEVTGKPVFVTEVGFPTQEATGDSNRYTETQQAWALYHFDEWAASTGYVPSVEFYGYRGDNYGIETHAGAHKRAYSALKEFSHGEPCGVCS